LIAFSPFQLDLKDERLCRGDSPVELRPKVFQVLRYLVEHAGRLVTRDELLDAVWPGLAIAPETLTQVIAELRRALGDDAHHPDFIQTIHRRGFRFIAEVEREFEPAHEHEESSGITARPTLFPPRIAHRPVGRDAELAHLGELLRAARAGQRQIAFVTGEPGIGKTSLVRSFLGDLAAEDEPVWIGLGKCVEHHGEGEAYLPILDVFERLAHQMDTASFVRHLSRYAPSWLAQLPWLTRRDAADEAWQRSSNTTQARMLREFLVAMEALSEERTLVLWLEDVHWADTSTVDLLAALAVRPDPARLLVLATYRPVDAAASSHPIAPLKRSLVEHAACEELQLEPLDEISVRAYLSERLRSEPDPALAALIYEHSEGNPLFMATLVNHFFSEGRLEETRSGWKLATSPEALRKAAPESLGALVEAQLDKLDAEELELLQAASVVGEGFAAQTIAAATGRDVETAEKVCGRLASWGRFLESAGPGRWPDGSAGERYHFLHAVFRHVIYRSLPAGLRQRLHHRTAERIEEGFADGAHNVAIASPLALHFEQGGDPERAIEYLVAAAVGVRRRSGDREALAYFKHALALLAGLPESVDRDKRELELRIQWWKELNSSMVVSTAEHDSNLERALELCGRLGDSREAYVSSFRTRSLLIGGHLGAAASVEQQLELASSVGDPILLAAAHGDAAWIAFYRGELTRARHEQALCVSALEDVDPQECHHRLAHDPGVLALGFMADACGLQGRPDQARRHAVACLARSEASRDPKDRCYALILTIAVERLRRDAEPAGVFAKSFDQLLKEHELELPYPEVWAARGWAYAQSGEMDTALAWLREGIAVAHRTRVRQGLSRLLATLAEVELERGGANEGLAAIEEAHAFVEESGERFWEAEIHRIEGELRRLDGEDGRAEACFETALDVAQRQGALLLELRAATSLARLYKETGRGPEARSRLADVVGRFSEGFDTADLQDAAQLLESP
jgi:DNA-binding winged helix-turn-helix (wHTH) protein/tetratricopeptide (TPR) repeat protein